VTPLADLQVADLNGAYGSADQFHHLAFDGLDHAAHLTVAAFGDADLKMRV
jgi:hypothetical protein